MSFTFRFVTSSLKSVYGTFTAALAEGRKYRMSRKFAARMAMNVSHARRGGMLGFGAPGFASLRGVGEPVGGVGGPLRRWGVVLGVAMPKQNPRLRLACG